MATYVCHAVRTAHALRSTNNLTRHINLKHGEGGKRKAIDALDAWKRVKTQDHLEPEVEPEPEKLRCTHYHISYKQKSHLTRHINHIRDLLTSLLKLQTSEQNYLHILMEKKSLWNKNKWKLSVINHDHLYYISCPQARNIIHDMQKKNIYFNLSNLIDG